MADLTNSIPPAPVPGSGEDPGEMAPPMPSPDMASPAGAMPSEPMPPTAEPMPSEPMPSDAPDGEKKGSPKEEELRKIAEDYVVPVSDNALKVWADKDNAVKLFEKYIEQMAVGMYPTLAPQIEAGIPTKVLLDPYVMVAEQVLGTATPDWTDPKWSAALQGGTDPKTGRPVPMTLDQWRQHLMSDPGHGWEKTPAAHDRVASLIEAIHSSFNGQGEQ